MPARLVPLVTGEFYHILNRGNASFPIFRNRYDYRRFLNTFLYYQYSDPKIRFSRFLTLNKDKKSQLTENLTERSKRAILIAYCLMPNHFHFLLKQEGNKGIYNLIRQFTSSYSHYFNTKYSRRGSLFEGRFKTIRIETDSQLLHLSRYIHLNPYSSFLVKDFKQLLAYPYSSLPEYLGKEEKEICQKEIILENFSKREDYKKFILDQADYQRTLEEIKHQLLEE